MGMEPMTEKYSTCIIVINSITGKLLTVSRKDNHKDLGLAGGKQEIGETPKQCAVRELKEETGLIALEEDLIEVYSCKARTSICTAFYAIKYSGEINPLPNEGIVVWSEWDAIMDESTTFHAYNRGLYKAFKEYLANTGF